MKLKMKSRVSSYLHLIFLIMCLLSTLTLGNCLYFNLIEVSIYIALKHI
jgi:hypothetical protein